MTLLSSLLLATALAVAQVGVPPLKSRVTDLTGTLNAQQRGALEQTLAEFESRKGSQIAVLLVPTTQPETPVAYGVRVFDSWKLGRKGVDDGVLLLVAKDDRRVWIVTGRGVEGVLPDAIVRRIVEEDITPRFKQGDFYGGIRAGADRMMRLIEGEKLPPAAAAQGGGGGSAPDFFQWFVIAFFIAMIGGQIAKQIFGRILGSGVIGGGLGFFTWLIASSVALAAGVGVVAFILSLVVGLGGRGGGWSSGGGFSGGGGGGFSGGGGGFSGGGGSTGGGGAGGSW